MRGEEHVKDLRERHCEGSISCLKNMNRGRCEDPQVRVMRRGTAEDFGM